MEEQSLATSIATILTGLSTLITSIATLIYALKVNGNVKAVRQDLNGRLDQLLAEQQARIQAQTLLAAARAQQQPLPAPPATGRADPVIRTLRPDLPREE